MVRPSSRPKMEKKISEEHEDSEISCLKKQNSELARALSETKVSLKQSTEERDYFQKQMLTLHIQNSELLNYLKLINQSARKSINAVVVSSNYITEIAEMTLAGIRKSDSSIGQYNSFNAVGVSPSSNKMQAVKPMIDGHVIHRPTISLRRVNEMTVEELRRVPSNSHTQHQNTSTNVTVDRDENHENSTYRRRSSSHHNSSEDIDEDGAQQSDPSPNLSEEHININRLNTIEELTENIENSHTSEADISTLANASAGTVTLPGHNSQGPLLSGVFRDVCVYLSPIQDPHQYLESHPGVTTERGGAVYASKKLPKKHYTPKNVSFEDKNHCPEQSSNNIGSVNNSFEDSSLLTSTRMNNSLEEACRAVLSDYEQKKIRWENNSNCEILNKTNLNNESGFSSSSKWMIPKRKNSSVSSYHTPSMTSTAYDPLEGPSTLLDSNTSGIKEKLERLSILGLQPKSNVQTTNDKPSTPASAVLKRRKQEYTDSPPRKVKKTLYITERRAGTKMTVVCSKLTTKRKSASPLKVLKKSLGSSTEELSPTSSIQIFFPNQPSKQPNQKKVSNKPRKNKVERASQHKSEPHDSSFSSNSSSSTITRPSSTKKGNRKKSKTSSANDKPKKSVSPQKKTPKQNRTRKLKTKSLKEPSLNKKLRRS